MERRGMLDFLGKILRENGLYGHIYFHSKQDKTVNYMISVDTETPTDFDTLDEKWYDEVIKANAKHEENRTIRKKIERLSRENEDR